MGGEAAGEGGDSEKIGKNSEKALTNWKLSAIILNCIKFACPTVAKKRKKQQFTKCLQFKKNKQKTIWKQNVNFEGICGGAKNRRWERRQWGNSAFL